MRAETISLAALVAVLVLLVGGCSGTPITPTANRTFFSVRLHVVPAGHVGMACVAIGAQAPVDRIAGCSQFNEKTNTLDMWVVEPSSLEDSHSFHIIGHEFWHGVRGEFHK